MTCIAASAPAQTSTCSTDDMKHVLPRLTRPRIPSADLLHAVLLEVLFFFGGTLRYAPGRGVEGYRTSGVRAFMSCAWRPAHPYLGSWLPQWCRSCLRRLGLYVLLCHARFSLCSAVDLRSHVRRSERTCFAHPRDCPLPQDAIDAARANPFRAFVGSIASGAGAGAIVSRCSSGVCD